MPSTQTTRTKRIPSNPKRTNNKPKLLPVINSYCLSGWTKVPLQPESQQQLRCILIAAMAGFKTPGQHWEAAMPMIAMFSVLGFPSQNAKIHYPVKKSLFLFWSVAFHALHGFASKCSGQSCGTAEQKKNRKQHKTICSNMGRQIHLMGRRPKHL